jgi:hypothetical protein
MQASSSSFSTALLFRGAGGDRAGGSGRPGRCLTSLAFISQVSNPAASCLSTRPMNLSRLGYCERRKLMSIPFKWVAKIKADPDGSAFIKCVPAVSYSPARPPSQYHRR